jgi:hypothetical protein
MAGRVPAKNTAPAKIASSTSGSGSTSTPTTSTSTAVRSVTHNGGARAVTTTTPTPTSTAPKASSSSAAPAKATTQPTPTPAKVATPSSGVPLGTRPTSATTSATTTTTTTTGGNTSRPTSASTTTGGVPQTPAALEAKLVLRIQSSRGQTRTYFKDGTATWDDLRAQIKIVLGVAPDNLLLSRSAPPRTQFIEASPSTTLDALKLAHGTQLWLVEPKSGFAGETKETKEAPKNEAKKAFKLTVRCQHNEKGRCMHCVCHLSYSYHILFLLIHL